MGQSSKGLNFLWNQTFFDIFLTQSFIRPKFFFRKKCNGRHLWTKYLFYKIKSQSCSKYLKHRTRTGTKELDLNVNFETIQKMGKESWRNTVRNTINLKSFRKLEQIKETHSKVKIIRYLRLEMQDYLMPNDAENLNKDEVQMIFKIRCRILNLKMNMKNQYDEFTCLVCQTEDETQKHVYECNEILKLSNKKHVENPKYEEIFSGDVHQKVRVARIMKENLKIKDSKIS